MIQASAIADPVSQVLPLDTVHVQFVQRDLSASARRALQYPPSEDASVPEARFVFNRDARPYEVVSV